MEAPTQPKSWMLVTSAAWTAIGYAACWLQSNWPSVCMEVGGFLQRVAQ